MPNFDGIPLDDIPALTIQSIQESVKELENRKCWAMWRDVISGKPPREPQLFLHPKMREALAKAGLKFT